MTCPTYVLPAPGRRATLNVEPWFEIIFFAILQYPGPTHIYSEYLSPIFSTCHNFFFILLIIHNYIISSYSNVKNVNKMNQRELELGIAGTKTSWHAQYKDSAWIFVGGLPYDLSEGDVICVFSQ